MGLQLDFNIRESDNTKELRFIETTGLYNAVSNPGGYGVLNDFPSSATIVTLKITPPNGTQVAIDMLIPVSGFPTFDKNVEYIIKGQDLGIGTDPNIFLVPRLYDAPQMERINAALDRYAAAYPQREQDIEAEAVSVDDAANAAYFAGEYEKALKTLEGVLSIPSEISAKLLLLDPRWEPLRSEPTTSSRSVPARTS